MLIMLCRVRNLTFTFLQSQKLHEVERGGKKENIN